MAGRRYDWLVVGAGLSGAVFAERLASRCDRRVLVIERRRHIGGNVYDERDEHGVLCHRYGPHVLHTNSPKVVDYLSAYTDWRPYEHRVLAAVGDKLLPVPFNLNALDCLLPEAAAAPIREALVQAVGANGHAPVLALRRSPTPELRDLGELVYANLILGYTLKQWALLPEAIDAAVIDRVPVRASRDDRHFLDTFQKMPRQGYTAMVRRILSHPNITVAVDTDFAALGSDTTYDRLAYTGAIDEFFGYRFGPLPYRSLQFEFRTQPGGLMQPVAQINYPGPEPQTRIVEMRHLTGEDGEATTLAVETPLAHRPGETIAYYPIPTEENRVLHRRYVSLAEEEAAATVFLGRLADYRYYNMDQAIARALALFERLVAAGG